VETGVLGHVAVGADSSSYALALVCSHGYAQTCSADEDSKLGIAACYLGANFLGNHGIIAACAVHAAHFLYFNAFFLEIFNNLLLQSEAGVIASNSYHYYHSFRDITAEQICALQ